MFNEKFGGYQNSGRIVISYNDGKDNATSIERIDEDNFDQKYTALSERSKQQIFTAFRATPNIFGLPTATTGFSEQEYKQAFNLYNRTVVKPIQKQIISTLNEIYDNPDYIKIEPFTLN